jgi:hypothetical protein
MYNLKDSLKLPSSVFLDTTVSEFAKKATLAKNKKESQKIITQCVMALQGLGIGIWCDEERPYDKCSVISGTSGVYELVAALKMINNFVNIDKKCRKN